MRYFEILCERTQGLSFSDDNFTFIVKAMKRPSIKAITRKFKKRIGRYYVNAIYECGNDFYSNEYAISF